VGAVVVVSATGLPWPQPTPPSTEAGIPYATWLKATVAPPNCPMGQLEIRTFTYTVDAGTLTLNPSEFVSFSFAIFGGRR
jgi:hypothetical protein